MHCFKSNYLRSKHHDDNESRIDFDDDDLDDDYNDEDFFDEYSPDILTKKSDKSQQEKQRTKTETFRKEKVPQVNLTKSVKSTIQYVFFSALLLQRNVEEGLGELYGGERMQENKLLQNRQKDKS